MTALQIYDSTTSVCGLNLLVYSASSLMPHTLVALQIYDSIASNELFEPHTLVA